LFQIINQLGNDRIGIVAYAGSAFPVLPITTDYSVAKNVSAKHETEMVSLKELLDQHKFFHLF
jgi:Ca-activated chloride channel family protein